MLLKRNVIEFGLALFVLHVGCTATTNAADMSKSVEVVQSVFRGIAEDGRFPFEANEVRRLIPDSADGKIGEVPQSGGDDLVWTSSDGACFVTFMVEDSRNNVPHVWAKCSFSNPDQARLALERWVVAFPGVAFESLPSSETPYTHSYLVLGESVALDMSLEKDGDLWLAGIGIRSGVTPE